MTVNIYGMGGKRFNTANHGMPTDSELLTNITYFKNKKVIKIHCKAYE